MSNHFEFNIHRGNDHLIEVSMDITCHWENPIIELPLWTPGSYLIREYAQHINELVVKNNQGDPVPVKKISKNKWQLNSPEKSELKINYSVYAFELTVRTSYLDNRKGFISPASICFYQVKSKERYETNKDQEFTISISKPDGWQVFTSLKRENGRYKAYNFDELIDSPIAFSIIEILDVYKYSYNDGTKNIPCEVVLIGDKGNHDIEKFSKDLMKLQDESVKMFGDLPYDRYYWILFIVGKGGGGLEHKYSNISITSRWNFEDPKKYAGVLSLEAHEHFHVYNIKRIRPKQLGPFNYTDEVYTRALWVAEGLTSFYDEVILPRAELISIEDYWKLIAKGLKNLYGNPGRLVQSIADSSFDAWIKFYRQNENSVNSIVSYYLKGGLVGLMLDLEIRKQTNFTKSLDNFYQQMYLKYKENKDVGYNEEDLLELLQSTTDTDLRQFWSKYIEGVEEIDLNPYLELIGFEVIKKNKDGLAYTGLKFKGKSFTVTRVLSDSPAVKAGIYTNDELLSIDGYKLTTNLWETKLKLGEHSDKKSFAILLFRDEKLLSVNLVVDSLFKDKIKIEPVENPSKEQNSRQNLFFRIAESTIN